MGDKLKTKVFTSKRCVLNHILLEHVTIYYCFPCCLKFDNHHRLIKNVRREHKIMPPSN